MPHTLYRITRERLLSDLYRAYIKARQHKACTADQQEFELNMEEELVGLADVLYTHSYRPSPSVCFVIRDPKQREVFAASFRDRVVHHLYYEYTHRLFESTFIADTYSCIEGRGTHYGISRLVHHIRGESDNYRQPCYILKVDVKGYFMHIDRRRLLAICLDTLDKRRHSMKEDGRPWDTVHDYDLVRWLTHVFTLQNPLENCRRRGNADDWDGLPPSRSLFFSPAGCGLPIGNLTSQLFSNVYMNRFDQYCKRDLRCRRYGRYVDDAYVVSTDREWLRSLVPQMRQFLLSELGLELHPNKTRIDDCMRGVGFLGAYVKPWRIYVDSCTSRRIMRKVKTMDVEHDKPPYVRSAVSSFVGVFSHYRSRRLCERTLCAVNPGLISKGVFCKGMRRYCVYRSVWRGWYRTLAEI